MFTFQPPPHFFVSDLDISDAQVKAFTPIYHAKKFSHQYHSATQPLHYENRLLLERNDIVLHLVAEQGRVARLELARVWNTLYYPDGSPIGAVLISPKELHLHNYFYFTKISHHTNQHPKKEEYYFRNALTFNQQQIHRHLTLLCRPRSAGRMWLPEKDSIVNNPSSFQSLVAYPHHPNDFSKTFLTSAVSRYAKMGNAACLFGVAFLLREQGRDEQAIHGFHKAAEKHFSLAWLELGFEYHEQGILGFNPDKSVTCFRQAAYGGLPLANYQLAVAHINGAGTEQSDTLALSHMYKAKEGGILAAYLALGLYYQTGSFNHLRPQHSPYRYLTPNPINHTLAARFFFQAANHPWQEAAIATYHLAECYRQGFGVQIDKEYARELYRQAAETGDMMREEIQSAAYYNGDVERLSQIAEYEPFAAYLVGKMYWTGEFAPKNLEIAQRYLKMAANSAHCCASDASELLKTAREFWYDRA